MSSRTAVVALAAHPSSSVHFVRRLQAEATRGPGAELRLRFVLEGELARLRIPPPVEPAEVDGLWRSTCFEAFVAASGSDAYCEINLAPSREWALYRFERYRTPCRVVQDSAALRPAPLVTSTRSSGAIDVHATIQLDSFVDATATWALALTAVIEDLEGRVSCWSARHAPGKPDFHHRDAFAIELAA